MKLKLESRDSGQISVTILSAVGPIEAGQVAVLKAGAGKLFSQTPRKPLLIDLTALEGPTERLSADLLALKTWALMQDDTLFVVSPDPALGDAPNLDAGLALLASAPAREAAQLRICREQIERRQRQKQTLDRKLSTLEGAAGSLRRLRKTNSDLRKRIAWAETELIRLRAVDPVTDAAVADGLARLRTAERVARAVLTQQGLLAEKPAV